MLENFTRLLSSLLAAGVPLSRALVILCKEATNPVAAAKWKQIYDSVVDGISLADSMAKIPDTFPRVYVAMVQAGETGGFLDLVLAQIADFQMREKDLRIQGDGRHALSGHSACPGHWRAHCIDDVLHSAIPENLRGPGRGIALVDADHRRDQPLDPCLRNISSGWV